MRDNFTLCYFWPILICNVLVGILREELGDDPRSKTHINSTSLGCPEVDTLYHVRSNVSFEKG